MLSALAGEVDSQLGADDRVTITLRKRRENVDVGDPRAPLRHHGTRSG